MDLFELQAKLKLDDSSFNKGINSAMGAGEKLKNSMSAATVAVGNLAADMIRKGVSAISGVINGAIDGYADYQQLIGGVETLFGKSANTVAKYAKQSFKTTGLSANDYMETVTSFAASLTQGLGGNTEKAAELANVAITDMADNVNKMGTDISMIQNAYQGFAKGNYTMLDNLKLGYGGTKGEMVRLINDSGILEKEISDLDGITFDQLISAIHKIQEDMKITGTTAKEAKETISGSKNSLKAAWEDMLSAVGGEGDEKRLKETMESFKESFSDYMELYIPSIVETIGNSGSLVTAIADSIGNLPKDLLAQVAEKGLESGAEMVGGVSKITNWLIDNISEMFRSASTPGSTQVTDFGAAIGEFLGETLLNLGKSAPQILFGMMKVGIDLADGLIKGLKQGLLGEGSEVQSIADEVTKTIADAESKATEAQAILSYMDELNKQHGTWVTQTEEWKKAEEDLGNLLGSDKVKKSFEKYGSNVQGAIESLRAFTEEMRKSAIMQALVSGQTDMINLLTEQTVEKNMAREMVNRQTARQQEARNRVLTTATGYAGELARLGETGQYGIDQSLIDKWKNLSEGVTETGEALSSLSNDQITEMIHSMYNDLKAYYGMGYVDADGNLYEQTKENQTIWGRSQYDDVLNYESIAEQMGIYYDAQQKIEDANNRVKELETEIAATKEQIELNKAVIQSSTEELYSAIDEAGTGAGNEITEGGVSIKKALETLGKTIGLWTPNIGAMPKATGVDYVPQNGLRAELHRGEGVLTAAENKAYRNGMGTAEVVGAIQEMRQDLQNLRLIVGTKTFGRAVVDYGGRRVNNYIGEADSRAASGYGA